MREIDKYPIGRKPFVDHGLKVHLPCDENRDDLCHLCPSPCPDERRHLVQVRVIIQDVLVDARTKDDAIDFVEYKLANDLEWIKDKIQVAWSDYEDPEDKPENKDIREDDEWETLKLK